jgi:hypothetical protein
MNLMIASKLSVGCRRTSRGRYAENGASCACMRRRHRAREARALAVARICGPVTAPNAPANGEHARS